jgi:hypothetical protein
MEEENQLGKAAAFLPLFFSPFRAGGAEQSRADELAMSGRGLCADTHMDYNNRSFTVTTLDKLVVSAFQGCRSASMPPNKRQNIVDKPGDRKLGYVIILLALLCC